MDKGEASVQESTGGDGDNSIISSKDEVEELASELADFYIDYFNIDIGREQKRYEDSIEECLAHLEEVCSTLDSYKQNSNDIQEFADTIANKSNALQELYEQVDALEQYIFETNRLLNQLDCAIGELESHRHLGANKFKQVLGYIPKLTNIPRLRFFGEFFNEPSPSFVDGDRADNHGSQIVPIGEIIDKIAHIDDLLSRVTNNLNVRLLKKQSLNFQVPELNAPSTSLESESQVDGSWQELL